MCILKRENIGKEDIGFNKPAIFPPRVSNIRDEILFYMSDASFYVCFLQVLIFNKP